MQRRILLAVTAAVLCTASAALAFVAPGPSPLADKEIQLAGLDAEPNLARLADLPPSLANNLGDHLSTLGLDAQYAFVDSRGLAWATLLLKQPLVPGTGVGNSLTWGQLGFDGPPAAEAVSDAAWNGLVGFLDQYREQLGIDPAELDRRVGVASDGQVIQIYAARSVAGVPVRGAGVTATINHGNLILLGTERWSDVSVSTTPTLSESAAADRLGSFLAPFAPTRFRDKARLELLAVGVDAAVGQGYTHRLAWILEPQFDGLLQNYEAAVDAHSGEVIHFQDTNHYATRNVKGAVYPVSYDGDPTDGVEVAGYPMPFANLTHAGGTATADSGGNVFDVVGNMTTALAGPFIRMLDACGAISESSLDGDLDLGGTPGGVNCDVPPGASAGNTASSRSGFYELNRIAEKARSQLGPGPATTWLNNQLTSNMNINQTCNAFWGGGTVNFYREGTPCGNTGQLAGVFDHEWGHGIDDNGTNGSVSSPGEGIADLYAALRLAQSCVGRGFFIDGSLCGGYGDPCTPASGCTGIRTVDWAQRTSNTPHTVAWVNANGSCGSVHCRGTLYSESVWDLWKRDLPTIYGMSDHTAHEITTRLTYLGADNVGTWFVLNNGTQGGCAATGGYLQFLGADDDNGNLADGTPHMQAIFSAFNRHEIACNTPTVQDSGCASVPTVAPVVTGSPADTGAFLSWAAVPDATRYKIFRTDGEFGCSFGKTIVGETTGTSFADSGLQNGREYSYVVAGFTAADTCMGPTSSCTSVVPLAGLSAADPTLEICAGTDADFTITVSAPFAPPVAMSVMGQPAGTTATFVPNPLVGPLPQNTVLTIGNTAAVAAGEYLITATGDDTVTLFDANLVLSVFDAVPSAPAQTAPANGAVDVVLAPTYEWSPSTQGDEYVLEVDDDAGFGSIDYTVTGTDTIHSQAGALTPETTYFWRVRTSNICGAGATSATFSFTTAAVPPILLVDDDDNAPNTRARYEATLNTLVGLAGFDVWDTNNTDNEPTAVDLAPYQLVVWFTGDEFGGAAGPGAAGEAALASWLDNQNGCLFLSSQDYHWDRGLTSFMTNYLGVSSITNDTGDYTSVTGSAGQVFDGMGPLALGYAGAGVSDFSDRMTPNASGSVILTGNNGFNAGLHVDAGTYQTFFLAFPWEVIETASREAMLSAVMAACNPGVSPDIFADGFESGDYSEWSGVVP